MAEGEMEGCRGLIFLYHEATKRVTIKWIGKEVESNEKKITEKTLLSLFAECACEEDEDWSFEYNTLTPIRTPAERKENLEEVSAESETDETPESDVHSDEGDEDAVEEVYITPILETSVKAESHELLFDTVGSSDSGVIKMHVDPRTGTVDIEGNNSDQFSTDEEMEIIQMIRKSKELAPSAQSKGQESRPCKYCGKIFTRRDSLYKHEFIHTGERPHKCTLCDKAFTQKPHLKIHLLTHTKERPHKCRICDKSFAHKATLNGHELTHTGDKPHLCAMCGKTFKSRDMLRRHESVHTGGGTRKIVEETMEGPSEPKPRPHVCAVCGKAFGLKRTLANHELTHTGIKAHKCSYCGKAFSLKGSMQTHELTHTGEKPHQCPVCDRRFTQLSHLKAHVLTHTGARPHECSICGKAFALRGNLRAHELTHIKRA